MAPFRGNRSNVFATCVLATFTSVCRSILPALTPQVYSRFIRSSSEGIPFGIFVKSDSPMRFWPSKSNGAWPALERAVIDVHVLGLRRNDAPVARIKDPAHE